MVVHSRTKRPAVDVCRGGGCDGFSFVLVTEFPDFCHIKALEETHIQLSEIASL